MGWKVTFQIKEGDPLLPMLQQKALFTSLHKIVEIFESGKYCLEYGRYIFTNSNPNEKEIIDKYGDFFKNAALAMLNTSILEILKLLAPTKSNDHFSLARFIQKIQDGSFGKTTMKIKILDRLIHKLELLHPSYIATKTLRDKVIAHSDPNGIPEFSVQIIEHLYSEVLDILIILFEELFQLKENKFEYRADQIKEILNDLSKIDEKSINL